jgi:BirA family biotin operon repressor/biotin-[acetyl-CoA-carboxylase] ligase
LAADDLSPLADEWKARSALRGRRVTIDLGGRTIAGMCQGTADDGSLLVQTPSGVESCNSGVVTGVDPPLGRFL